MEFWDTARVVGAIAIMLVIIALPIWGLVLMAMELIGYNQGFHNLQMAYQISREDIENLTKEEWKKTRRMSYEERTSFLKERFPNSVPEISEHTC